MTGELEGSVWQRFDHDPRLPAHRQLRAGDRDRDVVGEVLTQAFAEGRLDRDELDERQDRLRATRTLGDLSGLVVDLVPDTGPARPPVRSMRAEAEAQYRQRLFGALSSFLVPTLICWIVWLSTTGVGSFPWPLFVTIGTAMGPIGVLANGRERQVTQLQQQLEEKERRRLERRQRRLGRGWQG